jgi:hypothetical protein
VASAVIATNLEFLEGAYQREAFNLWEEETGALPASLMVLLAP